MARPTKEQIKELFAVHTGREARSERLLRSYGVDDTRSWIDGNQNRLSDRLWLARRDVRKQIDDVLRRAVANGTDALEIADILEQFLDPEFAPVRNVLGRLVRNQAKVIVTKAPGRGGMGPFPARRLARTEVSRAHAQATLWSMGRTPFAIGVRWTVSGSHPKSDPCDEHANRNIGLGRGVYPVEDAPRMPEHPLCLCHYQPVVEEDDDLIVEELRRMYDL